MALFFSTVYCSSQGASRFIATCVGYTSCLETLGPRKGAEGTVGKPTDTLLREKVFRLHSRHTSLLLTTQKNDPSDSMKWCMDSFSRCTAARPESAEPWWLAKLLTDKRSTADVVCGRIPKEAHILQVQLLD